MAYTTDLKSVDESLVGSSPTWGIMKQLLIVHDVKGPLEFKIDPTKEDIEKYKKYLKACQSHDDLKDLKMYIELHDIAIIQTTNIR